MADQPRYVALVEYNGKIDQTYVFDGSATLDSIFDFVNDRRVLGKATSVTVHLDQSTQPPWYEKFGDRPTSLGLAEQS